VAKWALAGPPERAPSSARKHATSAHAAPAASEWPCRKKRARIRPSAAAKANTATCGSAVHGPRPLPTIG